MFLWLLRPLQLGWRSQTEFPLVEHPVDLMTMKPSCFRYLDLPDLVSADTSCSSSSDSCSQNEVLPALEEQEASLSPQASRVLLSQGCFAKGLEASLFLVTWTLSEICQLLIS